MGAPRLLPKTIVNATAAQERRQEIDRGIRLAKAIEALREAKVKEEIDLERFRVEKIQKVQVEINSYIRERDALKEEINTLQILLNEHGRK